MIKNTVYLEVTVNGNMFYIVIYFSVKGKELTAFGCVVKKCCFLIDDKLKNEIQITMWRSYELNSKEKSQNIISGFFKGFMDFCEVFPLKEKNDKSFVQKLYKEIKNLAILPKDRKFGNRGI